MIVQLVIYKTPYDIIEMSYANMRPQTYRGNVEICSNDSDWSIIINAKEGILIRELIKGNDNCQSCYIGIKRGLEELFVKEIWVNSKTSAISEECAIEFAKSLNAPFTLAIYAHGYLKRDKSFLKEGDIVGGIMLDREAINRFISIVESGTSMEGWDGKR